MFSCLKFYIIAPVITFSDVVYLLENNDYIIILSDVAHIFDHVMFFYFIYVISLHLKLRNILNIIEVPKMYTINVEKNKYVQQ